MSYESSFGLAERPFSLTPDPKYFYKSRSHGRAIETITFGLRRRERILLVTADLGVGKTIFCRTLVEQLRRRSRGGSLVGFISNPLITPQNFFRLLLADFGAMSDDELQNGESASASAYELQQTFINYFGDLQPREGAVLVIDEAHTLPAVLVDHLMTLIELDRKREKFLQIVLVGQAVSVDPVRLGISALDEHVSTRGRLLPLTRDECAAYVAHRVMIAGGAASVSFSPRASAAVHQLSGGVPRLINLICERALQEASADGAHKIEPAAVEAAASALQLLRSRPRRFRWFGRRVS